MAAAFNAKPAKSKVAQVNCSLIFCELPHQSHKNRLKNRQRLNVKIALFLWRKQSDW
jgi:hypothetical protein